MEWKDNTWRYSQCRRYVNSSVNNNTTSCDDGWYYDKTEFHSTIVSDVRQCLSSRFTAIRDTYKVNTSNVAVFP